jgi:hypothetical protein
MAPTQPRGKFLSWTDQPEGRQLAGRFEGLREGKYGPLADFITAEGTVTTALPTVLKQRLAEIEPGTNLLIEHLGLRQSQKNPTFRYRDFRVEIVEPDAAAPTKPVAVDRDVPF